MTSVTRLIEAARSGDRRAAAELLPLVYDELRRLAAANMAEERAGHSLDATGLVHEAYLRLVGDQKFAGRGHFFAAAAEAMRRILVDQARARVALKRGGGAERVDLDPERLPAVTADAELLNLDSALEAFQRTHPDHAALVKLRYFAGMTADEAAASLGISASTGDRHWTFARAWLKRAMS